LLLIVLFGLGLGWQKDAFNHRIAIEDLKLNLQRADERLLLAERRVRSANSEADVLSEEIRRLRGIVKSSIADQRDWFELEVSGNKLVAIRPAVSQTSALTLETVERIEYETELEAPRLRHFLTPVVTE
jgi:hypothetical protein